MEHYKAVVEIEVLIDRYVAASSDQSTEQAALDAISHGLESQFTNWRIVDLTYLGEHHTETYTCTICGKQHAKLTECDAVPFERLPEPQQAIITRLARAIGRLIWITMIRRG